MDIDLKPRTQTGTDNPLGLRGIEFTEFAGVSFESFDALMLGFGFSRLSRHKGRDITLYRQNDICFLRNAEPGRFAAEFAAQHGPSICAMGWRVDDAQSALTEAVKRGAMPAPEHRDMPYPAILGIGGSLIYFIDRFRAEDSIWTRDFKPHEDSLIKPSKGFLCIDHLTNNVPQGTLNQWSDFYKDVFGFTEVRHFDIEGTQTGLLSYALRSPDGTFCIPINEPKSDKDQIAEYLNAYNGPGVQHIAFLTKDILASLDALEGAEIPTLDIDDDYYAEAFQRHPAVADRAERIRAHQVLVDGDENGYLMQIFTKNLIGPIFVELIQRERNLGFGEGNFGALFRSIERDQQARGVL